MPPLVDGESAVFAHAQSRQEEPDARSQEAKPIATRLMPLLERADILVEQFRPGVMARLGLGYDDVRDDQSEADLLLDHRLRPERPARRRGRPRPQLHRRRPDCWRCSRGRSTAPVVPPALIADIGGGTFPAVINILLALRAARPKRAGLPSRHRDDRRDVHLRLVRAGARPGRRPISRARRDARWSAARRAISSIRRRTARSSPAARWSRNSGCAFTAAIGLRAEFIDDRRDPEATQRRGRRLIVARNGGRMAADVRHGRLLRHASWRRWRRRCAIRISSNAACSRIGFENARSGKTMPALPVPIDPQFRAQIKLRRASAAAVPRPAQCLRASRRGAAGRSGRSYKARGRASPAPAGNPSAACG